MAHLLALALSFPVVVFTVLLGVALVYWVFVLVGAAHVDVGGDGALDGAADHLAAAAHGDVSGADPGLLSALRLRSVPATVLVSALVFFSWVLAMLGALAVEALRFEPGILTLALKVGLLLAAPALALAPASLAVRPLARLFAAPRPPTHHALVGKLCTIRTGTVTDRFGEATLEDGGAGVVVRVRVGSGERLGRGDQALIVDYDAERQEFTVAPAHDLLGGPRGRSG